MKNKVHIVLATIWTLSFLVFFFSARIFIRERQTIGGTPIIGTSFYMERYVQDDFDTIVSLINLERLKVNSPMLDNNSLLYESAWLKSQHMYNNNYFSHIAPDGTDPWGFFEVVGYDYKSAGENLAHRLYTDEVIVEAFMHSKGHRENILSEDFTEIGIGRYGEYVTVHFGKLNEEADYQ